MLNRLITRPAGARRALKAFALARLAQLAVLTAALAPTLAVAAVPPFTIRPLVLEGDAIPGGSVVADVSKVAVNNDGEWVVIANQVSSTQPEMVIRGGRSTPAAVLVEGGVIAGPFGPANLRGFGSTSAAISPQGRVGANVALVDAFSFPQSGLLIDGLPVQYSDQVAYQDDRFATWSQFLGVKLSQQQALVLANVDDFAIPGTSNRALIRLGLNAAGGVASTTRLLVQGAVLPGQTQPLDSIASGDQQWAFSSGGDFAFLAQLAGSTPEQQAANEALYLNGLNGGVLLAQKGAPSIVPGAAWGPLAGNGSAVALGGGGDVVFRATLTVAPPLHQVIVKNGAVYVRTGDPAPGVPGRSLIALSFGETPVRTTDAGDVLYYAKWSDPILSRNTGLYLNRDLLLQTSVTTIAGRTLTSIASGQAAFDISPSGRFIIFVGQLPAQPGGSGPTDGAFLIEFRRCPADFDGDGALTPDDLSDFITCYFTLPPCPRADQNLDGGADPDDLSDIITAYFAGGC